MKTTTPATETRPFDIYLPATENRPARKVTTIEVQIWVDEDGDEILTAESIERIDRTQAYYMGLMLPEDIRSLRQRYRMSQEELSDLIGCGKKSLSRWENGHGFASRLVNTLLRALAEGMLTPAQLYYLQQPRSNLENNPTRAAKNKPATYQQSGNTASSLTHELCISCAA